MHSRPHAYRPDIDGLRAISALAIFAFHLGFVEFSGGFVGVDIFFVISGYLIVPRIVYGLENNTFSLKEFFLKRIRRILPALLLVLAFSIVVGYFILGPREYKEFAQSAMATLAFAANFFFNDRSDYFADASHQKPFLHAWSLGVEEQFYIIIPLILLALWKIGKFSPRKLVIGITVISFTFNVIMIRIDETNAFYLPMSRFWELGVGGLIALYTQNLTLSRAFNLGAALTGVALLLISIFLIDDTVLFPGENALLPVLGSGLLIFSGQNRSSIINFALGGRILRFLGRISYSIYLIHWPVIVFARIYLSRPFNFLEQILILVFSLVWATVSWNLVEKKLLNKELVSTRNLLSGVAVALLLLFASGWYTSYSDGIPQRMTPKSLAIIDALNTNNSHKTDRCEQAIPFSAKLPAKYKICSYGDVTGKHILFWGDSHSGMLVRAFHRVYGSNDDHVSSTGMPDCPPMANITTTRRKNQDICPQFVEEVLNYLSTSKVDIVVLASRWANLGSEVRSPGDGGRSHTIFDSLSNGDKMSFKDALIRTIREINKSGAEVIIVGPVPEIDFHVPDTVIRSLNAIGSLPEVLRSEFNTRQEIVLSSLKDIEADNLARIIYPHQILCNQTTCDIFRNNNILYTDDDHLSVEGARPILAELKALFKSY